LNIKKNKVGPAVAEQQPGVRYGSSGTGDMDLPAITPQHITEIGPAILFIVDDDRIQHSFHF